MTAAQQAAPAWGGDGAGFWGRLADLFNGGGRQGTAYQPRDGYGGRFDSGGILGLLLSGLGVPFGNRAGNAIGDRWLTGDNPGGRYSNGQTGSPGGPQVGSNTDGWIGGNYYPWLHAQGSGPRTVYVGDAGGVGDVNYNQAPGGNSLDGILGAAAGDVDLSVFDPSTRIGMNNRVVNGGQVGAGSGAFGVGTSPQPQQQQGLDGLLALLFQDPGSVPQAPRGNAPRAGGGGGGGNGSNSAALGASDNFLAQMFANGAPDFSIDPALQQMINSLVSQGQGGYGQFSNQIGAGSQGVGGNQLLSLILGELGVGGGNGGNGFGGGSFGVSSGRGVSAPNVSFRDIDPAVRAELERMTAARRSELELQSSDREGRLVAEMFGRGVERSSTALDQLGRLNYGESALLEQLLASEADQIVQLMSQQYGGDVALAQAAMAANAQRSAAGIGANAQLQAARMGTLADLFGIQTGALSQGFGASQASLTDFAGTLANLGLGEQQLNQGGFLGLLDSGTRFRESSDRLAGDRAAASASRFGSQLGYNANMAALNEQALGRQQNALLEMLGLDQNRYLADRDFDLRQQMFNDSRVDDSDRWWALLGSLGQSFGNAYFNSQRGNG